MNLLEAVRIQLVETSVSDEVNWRVFIGYAPPDFDQAIILTNTGGFPQDTQEKENVIETFQARVRASRHQYEDAHDKWWDMFNALNETDMSEHNIYSIQPISSGPVHTLDENNRHNFIVNFRVVRKAPGPIS